MYTKQKEEQIMDEILKNLKTYGNICDKYCSIVGISRDPKKNNLQKQIAVNEVIRK
jgi:hypothetical protein